MPGMKRESDAAWLVSKGRGSAAAQRKERGMKRASARAAGRTAAAKSRKAAQPATGLSKAMQKTKRGTKAWN